MNTEQISLVQTSFGEVAPISVVAAGLFYEVDPIIKTDLTVV